MSVVKSLSVGMGCMHQKHETIMDINKYYETITPSHAKIKELKLKGNSSILQARIHSRTKWSLHAHVPRIQTQNIFPGHHIPIISTFHIFPYLSMPSTPGKTCHPLRSFSSISLLQLGNPAVLQIFGEGQEIWHPRPWHGIALEAVWFDMVWLDRAWNWIIMHLSVSLSILIFVGHL